MRGLEGRRKEGGMRAGRPQRSRVTVKKEVKASAKAPRDGAELKGTAGLA